jgi:(E)-4-hydroxy-3-methylbut-2-enyl-diphosphate synthase
VRVTVNHEANRPGRPRDRGAVWEDSGCSVPLVGDFHYNGHLLLRKYPECAQALAKYRINPGNVGAKRRDENFQEIIRVARRQREAGPDRGELGIARPGLLTELMDERGAPGIPRTRRWSCGTR